MITASIFIFTTYAALVIAFIIGFKNVKLRTSNFEQPLHKFSIIIPFRNEANNLNNLLQSIQKLNYPNKMFEVLLVNDASEDTSCTIIESFQKNHSHISIQIIQNKRTSNSSKKDAIQTAVQQSKFNWIVATDADCEVPKNWLQSFNKFILEKQPVFISAAVKFKAEQSFLFHIQNLNFTSLIGSTIGAFGIQQPFLCNGANMCYKKEVFQKLNGFEGNKTIASGDDVFLLEKMVKNYATDVYFLKSKENIVITKCEMQWQSFLNQQIRWASKSSAYKNWFSILVGGIVFITNLYILIIGFSLFLKPSNYPFFIAILLQKMFFDILLIEKTASFLNTKQSLKHFPFVSLIYPFFTVIIALLSVIKEYEWKGRTFDK
ncbi:glycosyltransferase [Lutibacter holmesii]|uniref:Glycosyltransferase n=1 Tax=Lutibacter holmesii TaxID=1137985 RepID=A0ABW3WQ66_9FLAO